ncbi:MAG: DNA polymerase III subunit delta [Actinomycetales bacterium]|nr:DNA polymerase III subunit delta [Actinomycetales bacterium]
MTATWDSATLAPVVLVRGAEAVLAERAVTSLVQQARAVDPAVEVTRLEAAAYASGQLTYLASPSLFGERRLVVAEGAEAMTEAFLVDCLAYIENPADDVWLVLRHGGGTRGKRLLDAMARVGTVVVCEPLRKEAEKADFVRAEFRRARRRIEPEAVHALLDAVGAELRELDAAVRQLLADTTGVVDTATVDRYHGGRVEASGFRVADAAIAGDAAAAVTLARHAMATGTPAVPLVAALAAKLRTLAKVGAMRGRGLSASQVGLAPWQVQRAERELRGWTPEALADAITAVAQADAEVKGASRDPDFAVERAILRVAAARAR